MVRRDDDDGSEPEPQPPAEPQNVQLLTEEPEISAGIAGEQNTPVDPYLDEQDPQPQDDQAPADEHRD